MSGSATTPVFERAPQATQYLSALASAYTAGYRVYDPSHALAQQPMGEQLMLRDADIYRDLLHRWYQIAARPWSIAPADEGDPEDAEIAKVVSRLLRPLKGFTASRINLARADLTGARHAETVRAIRNVRVGDGPAQPFVVCIALKDMPKERFQWVPVAGRDSQTKLQYARIRNGRYEWIDVPQTAPLLSHVVHDSEETLGYGRGLREAMHYWWWVKTHVLEQWIQGAESFGHGRIVLKMASNKSGSPALTNAAMVADAQESLKAMRARHTFIIDKDDELTLLAPSGEAHKVVTDLYAEVKATLTSLCLHSVLPTGGGQQTGSFARAEVEQDSTDSVIDVLAEQLAETLTSGLIEPLLRWNREALESMGLGDAEAPRLVLTRERPQDPRSVADRVEVLSRARIPLKKSEVYDGVGFTAPGPDDDVFDWGSLQPDLLGGMVGPETGADERGRGGPPRPPSDDVGDTGAEE